MRSPTGPNFTLPLTPATVNTLENASLEGSFTLVVPAGYDLNLEAIISLISTTSAGASASIRWYDLDNASYVGSPALILPATSSSFSTQGRGGTAYYYERTTTERRFQLRILSATLVSTLRAHFKVEIDETSSLFAAAAASGLTALPATGGVLFGGNKYLADHTAALALTIDPAMLNLAKIVIEDYGDTTVANTIDVGTASDTFNGVAGPMGIDSGTGEYHITKSAPGTYIWRVVV